MFKKIFRGIAILYVVLLASYVSLKTLSGWRIGSQQAKFIKPKHECFQGGEDWNYCVFKAGLSNSKELLYVFHGQGQDEKFWLDGSTYAGLLQHQWQQKATQVPTVVTISFGRSWLVTPFLTYEKTGLLGRFKSEIFPTIEKSVGRPDKRYLLGASMGGINVLSVALEMPRYFSKIATLCPPLYDISPHAGVNELFDFMGRTGAKPGAMLSVINTGKKYFRDNEEWLRFSPLDRVRDTRLSKRQKFYVSAGLRDRYGLYEGTHKMALRLVGAGADVHWRPTAGDHCSIDIKSLAEFLVQ